MTSVTMLFKFNVSSFCMTGDIIDFQSAHFADIEQFKIDSHFADSGQIKIDSTCLFLQKAHSYFTEFGQIVTL